MGFFETLRRVLGQAPANDKVAAAWNLDTDGEPAESKPQADSGEFDRTQWQKKLKRILDELPASQHEWDGLMTESRALHFDEEWVTKCQVDEFMLLIRRAVSDRHFTEVEHRKLDLARDLIGIPEPEAEAALLSVVAVAEAFFGKSVERS